MPNARRRRPGPAADTAAPITFVVPGRPVDVATRGGAGSADGAARSAITRASVRAADLPGTLMASVQVGRRRGTADEQRLQARPGRDVVLLHLAGGPTLVLHPEHARDLMLAQSAGAPAAAHRGAPARGVGPAREVSVPTQFQWHGLEQTATATRGGATRGFMGDVLLAAVEIVAGPVLAPAQDLAADRLAAHFDAQVDEGVYALDPAALTSLKGAPRVDAMALAGERAAGAGCALVFVHGTFSDTESGFAKLWQHHPQRVRTLFDHYAGCVYALDHATLTASPVANALTLARACPPGARLHLVTHSRGGLVAEVLARAAALARVDDAARTLFKVDALPAALRSRLDRAGRVSAQRALDAELATLQQLVSLLRQRRVTVERIVRVAAPARGTLLASQRLDAYLSIFKWGLDLAQVPAAPQLLGFLAGVARKRLEVARLPGLAAMVPDSPLVRWLHAADEPVPGDLRVIAGDMQGDSVASWVKTLVADGFFWTDNDLVVQTRSMYGGAPRADGATFVLDQGGAVSHFNYFSQERTADAVVTGLTQAQPIGWRPIGPLSYAGQSATGVRGATVRAAAQPAPERPAVFVLPGILGSHLKVDGKRIWLGFRMLGGFHRLRYSAADRRKVEADGALGLIYDDLMTYLGRTHEVIEFAFDWRRPIEHEARRLGEAVRAALDARAMSGQPVRIVAHSMGGLVARTLQLECKAVWQRMMAHPRARLLMLGTPNAGSWAPMQCLSGDDTFGNALVAFGAPFQDHQARQLMAQFPGFLQLQADLLDPPRALHRQATWQRLAEADLAAVQRHSLWHADARQLDAVAWGVPTQAVLDQAVALRKRLDAQRDAALGESAAKLALVVGHARFTPDGFDASGEEGLAYLNLADGGDGRVTLASAMLPGVRTWRIDCEHGSLPAAKEAFAAYLDLLETGSTTHLPAVDAGGGAATTRDGSGAAPVHVRSRPARERLVPRPPEGVDRAALMALPQTEPPSAFAEGRALHVTVLNGDLSFVRRPLMVGHYASNGLIGTERVINRLIGGAMSASMAVGQYPDQPGTHRVFVNTASNRLNPLQMPRPESVVVVGLGEEGKLKGNELVHSVKQAVLALAQRLVERPGGAPMEFEIASTLLGSGGTGITPAKAAQLIAQGAREADLAIHALNERADTRPDQRWPRLAHLLLIELYLDRASDAWRALAAQAQAAPGFYQLTPTVQSGQGGLRRPLDGGYRGSDHDYIRATTPEGQAGEGTIEFTLDTKRARVEVTAQSTQARLVRELVSQAATDQVHDDQVGRTLFRLLVPLEIEPFLGGTNAMLLEVDHGTAGIPWEMLDTGAGARGSGSDLRPWAIRTKLVRRLRVGEFRTRPVDASADARVLVIGEPRADEARYARLAGARAEARAVRDLLAAPQALGGERVTALIADDDDSVHTGPDASAVTNMLLAHDWRIVHIAGHGEPPLPDDPRGVVLSSDTFLGPDEIRKARTVPELVFVNCCHLAARQLSLLLAPDARSGRDHARFASGVAEELIRIGVRCVVAAGWAVEDEPAEAFATTFYQALLRGASFMDAVAQAREAAHALGGNTWAAYQCYGDPEWTFSRGTGDAQRPARSVVDEFAGVTSPSGLTLALETLAVRSEYQGAEAEAQRARIRHLQARFEAAWGGIGAVAEAFAVAWDAAGARDEAIGWYERAVAAEDGSASLKASEQLGNLRARAAWEAARAATGAGRAKVLEQSALALGQALGQVASLAAMQPTQERQMLVASALKRRAMIEREQGRADDARQSIDAMLVYCQRAEQAGLTSGTRNLHYPRMGQLAARCALAAANGQQPALDAQALDTVRRSLQDKSRDEPDFWSVAGLTELGLYEALGAGDLAARVEMLMAEYSDLHTRIPGVSCWSTVLDQLGFVLHDVQRQGAPADRRAADRLMDLVGGYASGAG